MRSRHVSRLCRSCQAPMAGQEDACWRCGVAWAAEDEPRTTLRLVPAGAPSQAVLDTERWTNEGGSFASAARG
jgi:hypothetical protein